MNSMCELHGINHANINNCRISQLHTTEHYKRELVTNPYLFSKAHPATQHLLHLNSTSLELLKREMELEHQLVLVLILTPTPLLIFIEGGNGGVLRRVAAVLAP